MQQKNPKALGRPKIPVRRRRRTASVSMDPLTWGLLDRVVDVTPRVNASRVLERAVWEYADQQGLLGDEQRKAAQKAGLLDAKSA